MRHPGTLDAYLTLPATPATARPSYSGIMAMIEEEIRSGHSEEIAASIVGHATAGHASAVVACLMSDTMARRDTMADLTDAEIAVALWPL